MTLLEFLQEPPGSLNTSSITRESEKVRALLELNIAAMPDLPGTERYWQMYATRMRNQRRSRFAQRNEPRRSIELVGFLRHSLGEHTDTLIRMVTDVCHSSGDLRASRQRAIKVPCRRSPCYSQDCARR